MATSAVGALSRADQFKAQDPAQYASLMQQLAQGMAQSMAGGSTREAHALYNEKKDAFGFSDADFAPYAEPLHLGGGNTASAVSRFSNPDAWWAANPNASRASQDIQDQSVGASTGAAAAVGTQSRADLYKAQNPQSYASLMQQLADGIRNMSPADAARIYQEKKDAFGFTDADFAPFLQQSQHPTPTQPTSLLPPVNTTTSDQKVTTSNNNPTSLITGAATADNGTTSGAYSPIVTGSNNLTGNSITGDSNVFGNGNTVGSNNVTNNNGWGTQGVDRNNNPATGWQTPVFNSLYSDMRARAGGVSGNMVAPPVVPAQHSSEDPNRVLQQGGSQSTTTGYKKGGPVRGALTRVIRG